MIQLLPDILLVFCLGAIGGIIRTLVRRSQTVRINVYIWTGAFCGIISILLKSVSLSLMVIVSVVLGFFGHNLVLLIDRLFPSPTIKRAYIIRLSNRKRPK